MKGVFPVPSALTLVQWLKLPAWKGGDRAGSNSALSFKFQKKDFFLLWSLVKMQYCGEPPWPRNSELGPRLPLFESRLLAVSRVQCHVIHLTILRRISWLRLAYMCTNYIKWPKTISFLCSKVRLWYYNDFIWLDFRKTGAPAKKIATDWTIFYCVSGPCSVCILKQI